MRIALITYEYPPDTNDGGIATAARHISEMMSTGGHHVVVFTASRKQASSYLDKNSILVHRIQVKARADFMHAVVPIFAKEHQKEAFDVIEGPEFGADAAAVCNSFPRIPLVVRLHTPKVLIHEFDGKLDYLSFLRIKLGGLRRGINPFQDIEKTHTLEADGIVSPSREIGDILINKWGLSSQRVSYIPNPYSPSQELLEIPVETKTNRITFIGRLTVKKGVIDLAKAIPIVQKAYPESTFRFVGWSVESPKSGIGMEQYLTEILQEHKEAVEFTGAIPSQQIPRILSETDICCFPSHWENFPNVCLEAMAAGRGVVGSNSGGMASILSSPKLGLLVPPRSPEDIAQALIELLANPSLRIEMGREARKHVLEHYHPSHIVSQQEESYRKAIAQRSAMGARKHRFLL